MTDGDPKAKAVGANHVALEVDDVDEELAFYGHFLDFEVTSRYKDIAFIYFGDQFINFTRGRRQGTDDERHFAISFDDKERFRERLIEMGVELLDSRFLHFIDPWGNRVNVTYTNIQLSKNAGVLRGIRLSQLKRMDEALGVGDGTRLISRIADTSSEAVDCSPD